MMFIRPSLYHRYYMNVIMSSPCFSYSAIKSDVYYSHYLVKRSAKMSLTVMRNTLINQLKTISHFHIKRGYVQNLQMKEQRYNCNCLSAEVTNDVSREIHFCLQKNQVPIRSYRS